MALTTRIDELVEQQEKLIAFQRHRKQTMYKEVSQICNSEIRSKQLLNGE